MNKCGSTASQSRIIALVTLLAMLVAPLCAPVCSSRACADSSTAQNGDCHSSLTATDKVAASTIASKRACGSQEFPAAKLNETRNSPEPWKRHLKANTSSDFFAPATASGAVRGARYSLPGGTSRIGTSPFPPAVLRI